MCDETKHEMERRERVQRIIEVANAEAERRTADASERTGGYKICTLVLGDKIAALADRLARENADPTQEEIAGCLHTVLMRGHGANL